MKRVHLRAPSPALVISLIALSVALGGTSYAAVMLAKNSVGTRQLKNGAVTTKKIKNHAVSAAKLNLTGLTVPNAAHAHTADTATNAGKLGGLAPGSFVQGAGHLFSAHLLANSSSYLPIVTIPGLGELQAQTTLGNSVSWLLTGGINTTGQAVDETVSSTNGTTTTVDDQTTAPGGTWATDFGASGTGFGGSRSWTVQFAWSTGSSAHLVTLNISVFQSGSQEDIILQGLAQ